jgi:hypothetical protein
MGNYDRRPDIKGKMQFLASRCEDCDIVGEPGVPSVSREELHGELLLG